MLQVNPAGLIGLFALSLNILLLTKVALQPAEDRTAKVLFLGLLIAVASILAKQLYLQLGLEARFPHFAGVTWPIRFMLAPILLAYVLRLTRGTGPFAHRFWFLHLVPALWVVWYLWPFYWQDVDAKLAVLQSSAAPGVRGFFFITSYVQLLAYVYYSHRHIATFERSLADNFADLTRINLGWLNRICTGLVAIPLIDIVLPRFGVVSDELYNLFLSATALFIVMLAYSALGHTQISFGRFVADADGNGVGRNRKYERSGLREDSARYYLDKLEQLMTSQHLYLDDGLSLRGLAEQLNISPHHLSQILNDMLGTTFHDYINDLRIDHARRILLAEPDRTVEDVAYASGYANKSTFYNAFRSRTAQTPNQYRRQASSTASVAEDP